jgi:hypothetical protein
MLQKLTTGQQDFINIRNDNAIYVDKTRFIYQLLHESNRSFFLSRPRRFGKSLLVNTLKEVFLGNKQYFKGLFIEDKIEWKKYPVLHFDFSRMDFRNQGLKEAIRQSLEKQSALYQIDLKTETIGAKFEELIHQLREKTGEQVVILVDEYDKPITDYLEQKEQGISLQNRDILRSFYGILKGNAGYIRFFFLIGISRFSKVSIFSELNNLTDLTFRNDYHNICGCTTEEIEQYFTPHIEKVAQDLAKTPDEVWALMREWYNGYSWNGKERVYNPFSILQFLESSQLSNYWFESGTPKFLIELLKKDNLRCNLRETPVDMATISNYDITNLNVDTLLFQTGYLTIKSIDDLGDLILGYPNKEVEHSLLKYLLVGFSGVHDASAIANNFIRTIRNHDIAGLVENINILFASIPAEIFIAKKEAYYHSIIYLAFRLCGFHTLAEVRSSKGRLDAMLEYNKKLYLFEFKLDGSADEAVKQIQEKEYYKQYFSPELEIYFVGINFSSDKKEIESFLVTQRSE